MKLLIANHSGVECLNLSSPEKGAEGVNPSSPEKGAEGVLPFLSVWVRVGGESLG